jgi:hypothetical protein
MAKDKTATAKQAPAPQAPAPQAPVAIAPPKACKGNHMGLWRGCPALPGDAIVTVPLGANPWPKPTTPGHIWAHTILLPMLAANPDGVTVAAVLARTLGDARAKAWRASTPRLVQDHLTWGYTWLERGLPVHVNGKPLNPAGDEWFAPVPQAVPAALPQG